MKLFSILILATLPLNAFSQTATLKCPVAQAMLERSLLDIATLLNENKTYNPKAPPIFTHNCLGAPKNEARDQAQDAAATAYAETFLLDERHLILNVGTALSNLNTQSCPNKPSQLQQEVAMAQAKKVISDRIKIIETKWINGNPDFYHPFLKALLTLQKELQFIPNAAEGDDGAATAANYGSKIFVSRLKEVSEKHNLEITPDILHKLLKQSVSLGNDSETTNLIGQINNSYRFSLNYEHQFDGFGSGGGKSHYKATTPEIKFGYASEEDRQYPEVTPYNTTNNPEISIEGTLQTSSGPANLIDPKSYTSEFTFNYDACAEEPWVEISVEKFGPSNEVYLVKGKPKSVGPISQQMIQAILPITGEAKQVQITNVMSGKSMRAFGFRFPMKSTQSANIFDEVVDASMGAGGGGIVLFYNFKGLHRGAGK